MRGTRASGPSENAAPIKSPHQTSSAATLRTEGGEPPPFTASRTIRKAMRGPSVNRSRSGHLRRGPSTAAASRISVTVLALVVLMILPPAATAATGADPSNPSLDQYVESVPSSHGGGPPAGPLPRRRTAGRPALTRPPVRLGPSPDRQAWRRGRQAARGGGDLLRVRCAQ